MRKSVIHLFALGVLLLAMSGQSGSGIVKAQSACPSFPHTVPAGDAADLINSIACANSSASSDVINLTNSTYTMTTAYADKGGLPLIPSAASAGTLTINGSGATITRSSAGARRSSTSSV